MQLCSLYNSNCVEKLDFNRAQLYPAVVRLIDYSFFHYKSTIGYSFNIILNITRPSHDICNFPRRNLSNFFIPDDRCINASGCFKSSQSRYTTFSPDWEFSPAIGCASLMSFCLLTFYRRPNGLPYSLFKLRTSVYVTTTMQICINI